jgi:hypothetical protein
MKSIVMLLLPLVSLGQVKLDKPISLLDNKIQFLVPKDLSNMSKEMWNLKYHDTPRPALVLTDENGEINLLVDITQQPAAENQMGDYKDFRVANLKKTRIDVKILGQGIKKVNGKAIGFIKFASQASDQNVFNYYFFTVVNGKILLFTFNCIQKLQDTWEKVADDILNSIRLN